MKTWTRRAEEKEERKQLGRLEWWKEEAKAGDILHLI
jgi:hypothetical protein